MTTTTMKTMKVRLTFTESVLGSQPNQDDIYRSFVGSKAPDAKTIEDEVEAIGADIVAERGTTVFPRLDDGTPFVYDYQVKGFFKNSCKALKQVPKTHSSTMKNYKQIIDNLIFVRERKIPFIAPSSETGLRKLGTLERPLRAQTAQGERIALAASEEIPAGSSITFSVTDLSGAHEDGIREWLEYGKLNGLGQWHNGGHGRFDYEILEE